MEIKTYSEMMNGKKLCMKHILAGKLMQINIWKDEIRERKRKIYIGKQEGTRNTANMMKDINV